MAISLALPAKSPVLSLVKKPVLSLAPSKVEVPRRILPAVTSDNLSLLTLPQVASRVMGGLMELSSWMFYGMKRIGKSSLAAMFPGAIVFKFEIASQRVKSINCDCPSWDHFLRYTDLLRAEKMTMGDKWSRRVAVIDTPFEAYSRCKAYVCKKNGITYTSDDRSYGGIWDKISDEFRRAHMDLQALGLGLIVVCHDETKECNTRSGQKFDMVIPKLSKQADDLYRAIIENVIYYHYRDRQRWLTLRGSDFIFGGVIGDEDDPVFMTPDGQKVHAVYAGETAAQAFANLSEAYMCRQIETYSDETAQFEEEAMTASIREKAAQAAKQAKYAKKA
jgi:hypothetical protein